jgi:hypothetical protein
MQSKGASGTDEIYDLGNVAVLVETGRKELI